MNPLCINFFHVFWKLEKNIYVFILSLNKQLFSVYHLAVAADSEINRKKISVVKKCISKEGRGR